MTNTMTDARAADTLAVIDALHRYTGGIDYRDQALLASALATDVVCDFRPSAAKIGFDVPLMEGRDSIAAALANSPVPMVTSHSVSNARVVLDGDKATLDALIEAQHVSTREPVRNYLMKNRYFVELVRQDAHWVIRHLKVDNIWHLGDPTVLSGG